MFIKQAGVHAGATENIPEAAGGNRITKTPARTLQTHICMGAAMVDSTIMDTEGAVDYGGARRQTGASET